MNRLAAAMVFTSQGIPFFLQGEEFGRSKPIEGTDQVSENSYNLPLYTNSLKYDLLTKNQELYEYYKGLIAFRKAHSALRLATAEEIRTCIRFVEELPANVVAFTIDHGEEQLYVAYNANQEPVSLTLPHGSWKLCIDKERAGTETLDTLEGELSLASVACAVLVRSNAS